MIKDQFETFEVDKLILAMMTYIANHPRDGDALHILQLLKDAKGNNEYISIVKKPLTRKQNE